MAAAGKKSKKSKWIKASITDIIAEPTTIPTINNWADAADEEPTESYGFSSRQRPPVVLPSASRAARGGLAVDDESIPRRPPFIAHISNLPYDVDETAITELFGELKIINLRLPREGDRLKGYGYVDFEDRESLINAMNLPDLTIGGRRIRIDVATQDNDRRMGRGGRSDRDREYDPERTMGDWRSGPRAVPETPARGRNDARDTMRDRDTLRDRDRDSSADNRPGGWRDGDRPAPEPARTPYGGRDSFGRDRFGEDRGRDRGFGRDGERSGYGGRDGFRTAERDGFSREGRGFGGRGFGDRDRDPQPREEAAKPRERPKLNLLPRTVPREVEAPTKPADGAPVEDKPAEKSLAKPVPAEKVFGAAKPVDTAAKEREIEERLLKQEEESRRAAEDKDRWVRRNDDSGDRRGGARRDDRGKDSRSYNRDRRDYSKENKDHRDKDDRRDYKDDRDRRDRDDRDRRDNRDDRDRRDYRDERRDNSGDRRDSRDRQHSRGRRDSRDRPGSNDRRDSRERRESPEKDARDASGDRRTQSWERENRERDQKPREERNGRERSRQSRSRDRDDREEKPLPKLKEQEKPNFVASNKFSCLEDADDGASD
ncbi:eukaryotic translation initiation factor 4B [Achroia grisella]|uniref:eukaryotic translation initiation factor 4B n=1 Tax=Achroia grisella TaxID=688607 RepID=UPI0027D2FCB6|nr:eukaryotic translation initiation factor 4B [Achroia grisella]